MYEYLEFGGSYQDFKHWAKHPRLFFVVKECWLLKGEGITIVSLKDMKKFMKKKNGVIKNV